MPYSCGVYIGEYIEVVITKEYTLCFLKNVEKGCICSYFAQTNGFICRGFCKTSPLSETDYPIDVTAEYALNFGDYKVSDDTYGVIGKPLFKMDNNFTVTMFDGSVYTAKLCENLDENPLTASVEYANENNIAECLNGWHIRAQEWNSTIEIITPSHMYIFTVTNDLIYCRAARYATCDKGIVFDQNFRQWFQNGKGHASMYIDNRNAAQPLDYNEDLFDSNSCIFNDTSIYWSVKSVSPKLIELHGCGGDVYKWNCRGTGGK